jgi:hypothetical protein
VSAANTKENYFNRRKTPLLPDNLTQVITLSLQPTSRYKNKTTFKARESMESRESEICQDILEK